MKKKLFLFFLLLWPILHYSFAQAETADKIYSKTNNAIVTIYTFDANGNALSQGSGVVINEKGWIITNYHVYVGAAKLVVEQKNNIIPYSNIIASDTKKDILILKIAKSSFPSIVLGNSDNLKIGQKIYAVGSPLGFENSISEGIISGLRRDEVKSENLIQISAAISPGSSGGAVLNTKGELIGITTSTVVKGQNLNFAIPINEVLNVYNRTLKASTSLDFVLHSILVENKYGYINSSGQIIILPQFEDASNFSEGLARIKIEGKYGFINQFGNIVIKPQFDEVGLFNNGRAKFKIGNKYGFINRKGKIIINPIYNYADDFSEGFAQVVIGDNYHWTTNLGYIDTSGNYVIQPQYSSESGKFREGLAKVKINGKYGFISKKGTIVIQPSFDFASDFYDGLAWVSNTKNTDPFGFYAEYGCIDKTGKIVIPQMFCMPNGFSEGISVVKIMTSYGKLSNYIFINKKGEIIFRSQFSVAGNFHEGLAYVKVGDKFGYINTEGKFVINPVLDGAENFSGNVAEVGIDNHAGYIDKRGVWIWNPQNLPNLQEQIQSSEKRGFKSINIGDNQSKYIGSINLVSNNNGLKTYVYTPSDDDLYNVFNVRVNKINLTFDKTLRLVEITLVKSYSGSNSLQDAFSDTKKVDPNLIGLFGSQTGIININTSEELKLGRVWRKNKVTIKSYAEDYGMNNGTDLKITISDNDYIDQTIKSGF